MQNIINRFKSKYDLFHLNAYPFIIHNDWSVEEGVSSNGLSLDGLVKFYKSFGFSVYKREVCVVMTKKGKSGV